MADDTPELPVKPKSKLILILLAVNLVAVLGTGVYFMFLRGTPAEAEGEEVESEEGVGPKAAKVGPLIALSPIVVNLAGEDSSHYLKTVVQMEAKSAKSLPVVEASIVPIRDGLLTYFSSLAMADIAKKDKRAEMHDAVVGIVNEVLDDELIKNVYFTEFVVQ